MENTTQIIINKEYSLSKEAKIVNINSNTPIGRMNISTLSQIRRLSNLEKIKTIREFYSGIDVLNISGSQDYGRMLGSKQSRKYLNYISEVISETLPMVTDYHTNIFPERKRCYQNLESVILEDKVLETPIYNHSGVTGRTSIVKGFNFLTLKKESRKKLKHKDKMLVEVDFKSCEPFFFLKSQGVEIPGSDVYSWLSEKYGIHELAREKVKRGILSLIYGANTYTTSKIMRLDLKTVEMIKEDMGINDLETRLREEYDKNGFILNYYNRPITSDNNLVNYWIQSSAVDFCSLAFRQFCLKEDINPCFFIHDSMTFCVEEKRLKQVLNIDSIKEEVSGISIPVDFTVIN